MTDRDPHPAAAPDAGEQQECAGQKGEAVVKEGEKGFTPGICARCGKPAPPQFVVCDACQKIADEFNRAIRLRSPENFAGRPDYSPTQSAPDAGAPQEASYGNARCVCGHLSSRHACDHEAADDRCFDCDCEAFAAIRPSNQALMTRAIQMCERLVDGYHASHVQYVYEQLQHVRRYAEVTALPAHQERTEPQSFPSEWADAVNSAKGLCESEANRWGTASPGTADHWRSVAVRLGALWLAQDLLRVGAPARAAEWHPLEQLIARWRRIVEGLDHETQGDCISEGRRAYVDGKSRGIRHCADQLEKLLPPCALTGNSETKK